MEIMVSMIAFLALVLSWFVLPSQPRTAEAKTAPTEALVPAA
jgi:hypothetical protein